MTATIPEPIASVVGEGEGREFVIYGALEPNTAFLHSVVIDHDLSGFSAVMPVEFNPKFFGCTVPAVGQAGTPHELAIETDLPNAMWAVNPEGSIEDHRFNSLPNLGSVVAPHIPTAGSALIGRGLDPNPLGDRRNWYYGVQTYDQSSNTKEVELPGEENVIDVSMPNLHFSTDSNSTAVFAPRSGVTYLPAGCGTRELYIQRGEKPFFSSLNTEAATVGDGVVDFVVRLSCQRLPILGGFSPGFGNPFIENYDPVIGMTGDRVRIKEDLAGPEIFPAVIPIITGYIE